MRISRGRTEKAVVLSVGVPKVRAKRLRAGARAAVPRRKPLESVTDT